MASMRVRELAKEYSAWTAGAALSHSRSQDRREEPASVLSEANVEKIREALAPELGARQLGHGCRSSR